MTAEREIDYEALAQAAMRGMVRTVLARVAKTGLPGEHHFYIAFHTDAPGVVLSKRLKSKYPEEMTVVLQYRFADLTVTEDRFEVNLTFDGVPERLAVPFAAIKVFFDPSVPYGLQFEDMDLPGDARRLGASSGFESEPQTQGTPTGDKKPRVPRKPRPKVADQAAEKKPAAKPQIVAAKPVDRPGPSAGNENKVVNIDAFRKK
jgi:hypothetical protein